MSKYYEEYCRLLRILASLPLESEEADAIRDQMDEPWFHLTEAEIADVKALSARLYEEEEALK